MKKQDFLAWLAATFVAIALAGCNDFDNSGGLDPIRIAPQHKLKLPDDIEFDADGVHYLIEPYEPRGRYKEVYGAHYLVHARIDRSDVFVWPGEKLRPGPYRNYSYFYSVIFPEMRQPTPDEAKQMGWFIPGYLLIHVEFATREIQEKGIAKVLLRVWANRVRTALLSKRLRKYGLLLHHVDKDGRLVYLDVSDDGEPVNYIECATNARFNTCDAYVLSRKYPILQYTITFEARLLQRWREIIGAVRQKVDSQILGVYVIKGEGEK